ncbi:MAG: hypothetical protein Ct9H300mP4_12720 [Gammaproteobacteria bacterium]|nr:MAG: hypothetical protein Ct9H300mP4_12720 [Gammaproteobacteria bacterium]
MGCFWGAEKLFWQQDGVYSTSVGYMGVIQKTQLTRSLFWKHWSSRTRFSCLRSNNCVLKELLRIFWEGHDPTQYMRQGNDIGTQYRSAVYFSDGGTLDVINQTKEGTKNSCFNQDTAHSY